MWYELAGEGFHSPLTADEISQLFAVGRIDRANACKAVGQPRWRTIDELFPLLKYDAARSSQDHLHQEAALFTRPVVTAALGGTAALILLGLGYFLLSEKAAPNPSIFSPARVARQNAARRVPAAPPVTTPKVTAPKTIRKKTPITKFSIPPVRTAPSQAIDKAATAQMEARFQQERRRREQEQRDQAIIAERIRAKNERDAAAQQQATGIDTIVPLDQNYPISVGGFSVTVKVHDNDVTSFDIWINGTHYRDIKKQKGITNSGTDETFVYEWNSARLFYVWEISGEVNHCRMRVRQR